MTGRMLRVSAVTVVAAALLATVTGCSSDAASGPPAAASTAPTTPAAAEPGTTTLQPSTWNRGELAGVLQGLGDVAIDSYTDSGLYASAAAAVTEQAKAVIETTVASPPPGGTWSVTTYVGDYNAPNAKRYLGCAASPTQLVVDLVVAEDARSLALSVSTSDVTGYIVIDLDRPSQPPFDADGLTSGSGPCQADVRPTVPPAAPTVTGSFA
jgi:hypothetical protein